MEYKVSVIVLTYNPVLDRLYETLKSIKNQKKIEFEVIISDDGSTNNYRNEVYEFMSKGLNKNYVFLEHESNRGTVYNAYDAIKVARGKYVKFISPGDYFVSENILYEWVELLEKSDELWSYSKFNCYCMNNGLFETNCKQLRMPVCTWPYIRYNPNRCRKYYVGLEDVVNAAATICSRELFCDYLEKIVGKVIYAEDCVYRLMMFDGYVPVYFQKDSIFYETKSGISTNGSTIWREKLKKDCEIVDEIMLAQTNCDSVKDKIKKLIKSRNKKGLTRLLWSIEWRLFG